MKNRFSLFLGFAAALLLATNVALAVQNAAVAAARISELQLRVFGRRIPQKWPPKIVENYTPKQWPKQYFLTDFA